jgi:hypothetical protein
MGAALVALAAGFVLASVIVAGIALLGFGLARASRRGWF